MGFLPRVLFAAAAGNKEAEGRAGGAASARTTGVAGRRDSLGHGEWEQDARAGFAALRDRPGYSPLKTSSSGGKGSRGEPVFLTDREADVVGAHSPRHQGCSTASYRGIAPEWIRPTKWGPSLPCV